MKKILQKGIVFKKIIAIFVGEMNIQSHTDTSFGGCQVCKVDI